MKRIYLLLFLAFILISGVLSQTSKPDSTSTILKKALMDAHATNKNVFVIFHATWCKWCKRLESVLDTSVVKSIIDEHFVTIRIDVQERGEKQQTHENPGGRKFLATLHGDSAGLPFYAFLNNSGKLIENSNAMPDKQNIGYPGSKEEIAAFTGLLKKSAPHLTEQQSAIITEILEKKAPR
jgi:thioredoxin-related protein